MFSNLGEAVSDARRAGDADPNKNIAETNKQCIFVKLVTFTEKRIYKVLMDISILTVYNVCMSLFVGDCFPVAGI
jgi:hypothetical protein